MLAWTGAYGDKTTWTILQKYLESGEEKITDKAEVEQYVREQRSQNIGG